jgi:hypothetical protein
MFKEIGQTGTEGGNAARTILRAIPAYLARKAAGSYEPMPSQEELAKPFEAEDFDVLGTKAGAIAKRVANTLVNTVGDPQSPAFGMGIPTGGAGIKILNSDFTKMGGMHGGITKIYDKIKPKLKPGDMIEIKVDGHPIEVTHYGESPLGDDDAIVFSSLLRAKDAIEFSSLLRAKDKVWDKLYDDYIWKKTPGKVTVEKISPEELLVKNLDDRYDKNYYWDESRNRNKWIQDILQKQKESYEPKIELKPKLTEKEPVVTKEYPKTEDILNKIKGE